MFELPLTGNSVLFSQHSHCIYAQLLKCMVSGQPLLQSIDLAFYVIPNQADIQYPFLNKASCMLESISAPPAFASDFPSKDAAALRLSSTAHSSNSIHVTAGIIRIRNMTSGGNGTYWSLGKDVDVNIVISFGLSHNDASLEPKSGSGMSWGWLYLLFLWVLIISMSFKIGSYMYTGKAS